jgi:hypothetical protein
MNHFKKKFSESLSTITNNLEIVDTNHIDKRRRLHNDYYFENSIVEENSTSNLQPKISKNVSSNIQNIFNNIGSFIGNEVSNNHSEQLNNIIETQPKKSIINSNKNILDYFNSKSSSSSTSFNQNNTNVSFFDKSVISNEELMLIDIGCKCCNRPIIGDKIKFQNCGYCTKISCLVTCSTICDKCHNIFCKHCVNVSYSQLIEQILCPDCF